MGATASADAPRSAEADQADDDGDVSHVATVTGNRGSCQRGGQSPRDDLHRPAPRPDPGAAARRDPGGPRADGGHHQRGVPAALRRAGRRPLRVRDDHQPRDRRAGPGHARDAGLRRPRVGAVGPALRHGPGLRRQGGRDPLRGVRRRPHRPQLRLPGPQGHPQGRRRRPALEARPARPHPRVRGRRGGAVRRAGHHEDPQGHRRRPPDLPRRRADRPGGRVRRDRAARPDRGAVLLRARRLGGDRRPGRARRHPGAGQRRHLGGRGRAADGRGDRRGRRRRRPRLPGPALAVPRPGRGVRRGVRWPRCRRWARSRR